MRSFSLAVVVLVLVATMGIGAFDDLEFASEDLAERYETLIHEIRCPKCLNINIAESDAPIARDLRNTVHRLLHEGKSDKEIRDFLVARYGDFILYDPPLKPSTLALWILPVVFVLLGLWALIKAGVRRESLNITDDDRRRLEELDES